MYKGNEDEKTVNIKFSQNEIPEIPELLYNQRTTNYQTPNNQDNSHIILKNKIIAILRKNGSKFDIFIRYIERYKLSENIIKRMNIRNYERIETEFGNNIFLIECIPNEETHNKFIIDNIMKKVKKFLIDHLLAFIKNNLEIEGFKNINLAKISYEYKINLSKKVNINDLQRPIKDILCINKKNKKIIEDILEKGKNNEKIQKMFYMSFREWIDYFTMKKQPTKDGIIFDGFDSLLQKILNKNQNYGNYFYDFIFCVYNFEYWINSKKEINPKNKSRKNKYRKNKSKKNNKKNNKKNKK